MSNSSITTGGDLIEPIHPGEILIEDFIESFGITQHKLAVAIGVPPDQRDRARHADHAHDAVHVASMPRTRSDTKRSLDAHLERFNIRKWIGPQPVVRIHVDPIATDEEFTPFSPFFGKTRGRAIAPEAGLFTR